LQLVAATKHSSIALQEPVYVFVSAAKATAPLSGAVSSGTLSRFETCTQIFTSVFHHSLVCRRSQGVRSPGLVLSSAKSSVYAPSSSHCRLQVLLTTSDCAAGPALPGGQFRAPPAAASATPKGAAAAAAGAAAGGAAAGAEPDVGRSLDPLFALLSRTRDVPKLSQTSFTSHRLHQHTTGHQPVLQGRRQTWPAASMSPHSPTSELQSASGQLASGAKCSHPVLMRTSVTVLWTMAPRPRQVPEACASLVRRLL
jgi:hypothetical protein